MELYAQWDKILAAGGSIAVAENSTPSFLVSCSPTDKAEKEVAAFIEDAGEDAVGFIEGCDFDEGPGAVNLVDDDVVEPVRSLAPIPPVRVRGADLLLSSVDPPIYAHQVDEDVIYPVPRPVLALVDEDVSMEVEEELEAPEVLRFQEGLVEVTPFIYWQPDTSSESEILSPRACSPTLSRSRSPPVRCPSPIYKEPFQKGGLTVEIYTRGEDGGVSAWIHKRCRAVAISPQMRRSLLHRPLQFDDLRRKRWKRRICIYHQDDCYLAGQVRAAYARRVEDVRTLAQCDAAHL